MVRNVLVGLVIAGAVPVIVADATAIEQKNQVVSSQPSVTARGIRSCTVLKSSINCTPSSIQDTRIDLEFKLQNIAKLFLSSSIFSQCNKRSLYNQLQSSQLPPQIDQRSEITLPYNSGIISDYSAKGYSSAKIDSDCILPWRNKLKQKTVAQIPKFEGIENNSPFPKLSRSSLIVSLPQQDGSFINDTKFANPAPATKRIASPFGWRRRPYSNQLQFHQGIDYGAPLGSPVVAVGNGIITKVTSGCIDFGNLFCGGQLGNWIEIDHGNGAIAVYGHLKYNSITVKQGMKVVKNQEIAQVGSSGWSTGAHLDFRVKVNGEYEDPAKMVMEIDPEKNN